MVKIHEHKIHELRPTQLTIGMIEVQDKATHLASLTKHGQRSFMESHPIPAVLGPEEKLYITDHHHLGRAALEAGVETGFFIVEADFSGYVMERFWQEMDRNKWVHPLDENGVRHVYALIPHHLERLVDDVYRSLAGYVRETGGYEKTPTAFAEFIWADFFRRSIAVEEIRRDFAATVPRAKALALSGEAKRLPGYKTAS